MKLKFEVKLDKEVLFYPAYKSDKCTIDNAIVEWNVEVKNGKNGKFKKLVSFNIILSNIDIRTEKCNDGKEVLDIELYKDEKNKVLDIANYILDNISIYANFRISYPIPSFIDFIPETSDETLKIKNTRRMYCSSLDVSYDIYNFFNPSKLSEYYIHKEVFRYFADGIRISHLPSKFVLFYKVIEYVYYKERKYINGDTEGINNFMDRYLTQFDPKYTIEKFDKLRKKRNAGYHDSIEHRDISLNDCKEVRDIAKLIIKNLHNLGEIPMS